MSYSTIMALFNTGIGVFLLLSFTTTSCKAFSHSNRNSYNCISNHVASDFQCRSHKRRPLLSPLSQSSPTACLHMSSSEEGLSDWVVENLENDEVGTSELSSSSSRCSSITTVSSIQAGENDTLPTRGLRIGHFRILPSGVKVGSISDRIDQNDTGGGNDDDDDEDEDGEIVYPIYLLKGRNGWGTGVHPTTRLMLEWLCLPHIIQGGETVLDYGCGSGILSIGALHLGASHSVGIDIEAEALVATARNVDLNGFWGGGRLEAYHTREVEPYGLCRPYGADICLANILIGQLVRPSMVSAIMTNLAPNAYLVLSGIRPAEVDALKDAYGKYVDWLDDQYAELAACDTEGSIESYGFDVGIWCRLVGRVKKEGGTMDIETMSELAVS